MTDTPDSTSATDGTCPVEPARAAPRPAGVP